MTENWKEIAQEAKQNIWQAAAKPSTLIGKLAHGTRLTSNEETSLYGMMEENAQRLFGAAAIGKLKPSEPEHIVDGNFKITYLEDGVCTVVDSDRISFKLIYKQINWKKQWILDPNDAGSRLVVERIEAEELAKDYMSNAIALVEKYSQRK